MLQITNLDLQLGGKILLQNANLQIKPGMIAGLIGKNGAGKSSLMKVLTGKLEPEKGEIIKPEAWKFAYLEQELPESDLSVIDFACRLSNRRTLLLQIRICSYMVNIFFRINKIIFFGGHNIILSHA